MGAARSHPARRPGGMRDAGRLRPGLDLTVEAERLYALVDGLILHGLQRPHATGTAGMRRIVAAHLTGLDPSV